MDFALFKCNGPGETKQVTVTHNVAEVIILLPKCTIGWKNGEEAAEPLRNADSSTDNGHENSRQVGLKNPAHPCFPLMTLLRGINPNPLEQFRALMRELIIWPRPL